MSLTISHVGQDGFLPDAVDCASLTSVMKLLTAHKILIGSSAVFFLFFSCWELQNFLGTDNGWALSRSILYLMTAIGFGIYFKNLDRFYK